MGSPGRGRRDTECNRPADAVRVIGNVAKASRRGGPGDDRFAGRLGRRLQEPS
jgi:hypothetical protein